MIGDAVVEVDDQHTAISAEHDPSVILSLVVPTYEEADNIEALLRSLHAVLTGCRVGFEILVVDDDSPDRTWEVARNLAAELFFERHHELDRIEAVGAQIVDELRVLGNLFFVNAEVLDDNLLHAIRDVSAH